MREILIFYLVSVAEQAGLNLTLSETPKTGFLALRPIWKCSCEMCLLTGLTIRVCNKKSILLFLNVNICCWYSKEGSRRDRSFEHPKQMFDRMDRKIFTFLHSKNYLSGPMTHLNLQYTGL